MTASWTCAWTITPSRSPSSAGSWTSGAPTPISTRATSSPPRATPRARWPSTRPPTAGSRTTPSSPSGTAPRWPRTAARSDARPLLEQAFAAHEGWRELLTRLPAAGLFPDDPGLLERLGRALRGRSLRCSATGLRSRCRRGAGGNGVVSFRREAHVPKGGPDGGDGGRGGAVEVVCDDSLRDLSAFRRRAHYRAKRGGHGQGSGKHGATPGCARDPGTARHGDRGSRRAATAGTSCEAGQRAVVARGGSGGRGNRHFAAATRQTPRFAEKGLPGEERRLLPAPQAHGGRRARRSSQCRQVVSSRPSHPGTPEGGRLPVHHARAGAGHAGARRAPAGAGRHPGADRGGERGGRTGPRVPGPRRTLPAADTRARRRSARRLRPLENHAIVEAELREHGEGLSNLPRITCLSKSDLAPRRRRIEQRVERVAGRLGYAVVGTSAATGEGLDRLRDLIFERVPPAEQQPAEPASSRPPTASTGPGRARPSRCGAPGPGQFSVEGTGVERLLARHDIENEQALRYVEERLRTLGRDQGPGGGRLRARRRRGDRRHGLRARPRGALPVRDDVVAIGLRPGDRRCAGAAGLRRRRRGGRGADGAGLRVRDQRRDGKRFCEELVTQEFLERDHRHHGQPGSRRLSPPAGVDPGAPARSWSRSARPRSTATAHGSPWPSRPRADPQAQVSALRRRTATGGCPAEAEAD